jgi:hypothetical protein
LQSTTHAIMNVAPTVSQCTPNDLQCEQTSSSSRILIYERKAGSIGIAEALFVDM